MFVLVQQWSRQQCSVRGHRSALRRTSLIPEVPGEGRAHRHYLSVCTSVTRYFRCSVHHECRKCRAETTSRLWRRGSRKEGRCYESLPLFCCLAVTQSLTTYYQWPWTQVVFMVIDTDTTDFQTNMSFYNYPNRRREITHNRLHIQSMLITWG